MHSIKDLNNLLAELKKSKTKLEQRVLDVENAIEIEKQKEEINKNISDNILKFKTRILNLVSSRRKIAMATETGKIPSITGYIEYLPRLCGKTTAIVEASVDLKIAHPNIPVVIVTNNKDKCYELDMTDRVANYCVNKYGFSLTKENSVKLIRTIDTFNAVSLVQRGALIKEMLNKLNNTGAIIIFDLYGYNVGGLANSFTSLVKNSQGITVSDKFKNELASIAVLVTDVK